MNRTAPPAANDLLCEACGYTLNGLPAGGRCPECGTPVAQSTTQSLRRPPAWETDQGGGVSRFNRTAAFVALHPGLFGQRVSVHNDTTKSARFARITLGLTAYLNTKAVLVHLFLLGYITLREPLAALILLPATPIIAGLFWWGMLRLIAWLTTWDSTYRGYRMPLARVLRLLHYLSIHLVVASFGPLLVTTGAAIAFAAKPDIGLYAVQYLYALSGVIVFVAVYLFMVYWRAMKSVLYANDTPAPPAGATAAGGAT